MKRLVLALLFIATTVVTAQEKVLLRLNYEKGANYEVVMEMSQDMGNALMNMKMNMDLFILSKEGKDYKTKSSFSYLETRINAEGVEKVNYNSNMNDDELSEEGKKFKSQIKPILEAIIYSDLSELGENKVTKIEPNVPGIEKFSNQSSYGAVFPVEEVGVGSTWKNTQSNQGMSMELSYTVKEITDRMVLADISGKLSIMPTAKIKGTIEIDKDSGVSSKMDMTIEMDVAGMKMKTSIRSIIKKK